MAVYNNPLGLLIGQKVRYKRVCEVAAVTRLQNGSDQRVLCFDEDNHGRAEVTGCVKKALGTYEPASRNYTLLGPDEGDGFVPARLKVSEYVWLYEVRKDIARPSFLVHPDDIVAQEVWDGRSEHLIHLFTQFTVEVLSDYERCIIRNALAKVLKRRGNTDG